MRQVKNKYFNKKISLIGYSDIRIHVFITLAIALIFAFKPILGFLPSAIMVIVVGVFFAVMIVDRHKTNIIFFKENSRDLKNILSQSLSKKYQNSLQIQSKHDSMFVYVSK